MRPIPLREALKNLVEGITRVPVSWETGTCCCGVAISYHTAFDNHSPVDEGVYFISNLIRDAEEALKFYDKEST